MGAQLGSHRDSAANGRARRGFGAKTAEIGQKRSKTGPKWRKRRKSGGFLIGRLRGGAQEALGQGLLQLGAGTETQGEGPQSEATPPGEATPTP